MSFYASRDEYYLMETFSKKSLIRHSGIDISWSAIDISICLHLSEWYICIFCPILIVVSTLRVSTTKKVLDSLNKKLLPTRRGPLFRQGDLKPRRYKTMGLILIWYAHYRLGACFRGTPAQHSFIYSWRHLIWPLCTCSISDNTNHRRNHDILAQHFHCIYNTRVTRRHHYLLRNPYWICW